jgi:hypothetical protein
MARRVPEKSNETIVVIGGGAAGQECVETLRNRESKALIIHEEFLGTSICPTI